MEDLQREVEEEKLEDGLEVFTSTFLAMRAKTKHRLQVEPSDYKRNRAIPHAWPTNGVDLEDPKQKLEDKVFAISKNQQAHMLKDRWKSHYSYSAACGFHECDGAEDNPLHDLLDDDAFFVVDEDVYVDVTTMLSTCNASGAKREEYGSSNLQGEDDFEEKIKDLPLEIKEVLKDRRVAFGPRHLAHGTVKKLISMDLELLDDHKISSVRSKPFPASKTDSDEILRQINECISANPA